MGFVWTDILCIRTKPHGGVLAVSQFADHGISLVDLLADFHRIVESWDVHGDLFFFEEALLVLCEEVRGCLWGWSRLDVGCWS